MSSLLRNICSSLLTRCYFSMSRKACYRFSSTVHRAGLEEGLVQTTKKGVPYVIRPLTHADIPQWLSLRPETDNFVCVSCVHSWLESDPHGIQVAITSTGEIAGTCANVMNGDDDEHGIFFGGNFLVPKKYQSQGIGLKLWSSCFDRIGKRNAGLNAVPGKLETFRDSGGFPIHDDRFISLNYHTTSYPLDFTSFSDIPPPGVDIRSFDASHLPAIFAYDERLLGFRRSINIRLNLLEEGSTTLVAFGGGGAVVGFGTVKKTVLGAVRIGPLYADNPKVAEVLLQKLVAVHKEGKGFAFATTSANAVAKEWMERLGVTDKVELDRLYVKAALGVDLSQIFAQFDLHFAPF